MAHQPRSFCIAPASLASGASRAPAAVLARCAPTALASSAADPDLDRPAACLQRSYPIVFS
eukprot:7697960-Pyramimonas_sp.AAC.1